MNRYEGLEDAHQYAAIIEAQNRDRPRRRARVDSLRLWDNPNDDVRIGIDRISEGRRLARGLSILTQDDWRAVPDYTHGREER